MKKWILATCFLGVAAITFSSCNSMRDCHGVKHTRLSNGVRI